MVELAVAVAPPECAGPGLDLERVEFDGPSALATDQVVVAGEPAAALEGLTAVAAEAVDRPGARQGVPGQLLWTDPPRSVS
jgi:hypothetical protein